jgi:hypothetical protein
MLVERLKVQLVRPPVTVRGGTCPPNGHLLSFAMVLSDRVSLVPVLCISSLGSSRGLAASKVCNLKACDYLGQCMAVFAKSDGIEHMQKRSRRLADS